MQKLTPIPSPPGALWREFRIRYLPGLTFLATLLATIQVWRGYVGNPIFLGQAEVVRSVVTSSQPGRVAQLKVGALQRVTKGEPLVQLLTVDPKVLEAQLSLSKARIELVRANIDSGLRRENNRINFEQLRLDWMRQRAELGSVRARVVYLQAEYDRQRKLMGISTNSLSDIVPGVGLTSLANFQQAEANLRSAEAQVFELSRLVSDMDQTIRDLDAGDSGNAREGEAMSESNLAAIQVEERELALLEVQLAPVTLVSPIDGLVSVVHRRDGESVTAGEPILTLSAVGAERIVAYLRQPLSRIPKLDEEIEVESQSLDHPRGIGRIAAVGGTMEPISPALVPHRPNDNSLPEQGFPVMISAPPGMLLIPGEIVNLRPVSRN